MERIFTRPASGSPQTEYKSVCIVAGKGIEGDRYYDKHDEPGQNITFVEAEEIEAFLTEQGLPGDLSISGRNVITRGIRLNELVGQEFTLGGLRFRGVELCEPCLGLGEKLATPTLPPPKVVKCLVHKAGLRADALSSGELALGATFNNAA
ncbi:MAG: sulfurase [Burkholderiales bacterium PBB3]|nr:MAG: sulfurase [Burkholderiales bacterium PBB3]